MMLKVLALALLATCAVAETTVAFDDLTTDAPVEVITAYNISIQHLQSTTSSVRFKWSTSIPDWMSVQNFEITATRLDSDSKSVISYPPVPKYKNFFEAEDLVKDAKWEICVTTHLLNGTSSANPEEVEVPTCFLSKTIPYIRADSLYWMFIVLGYIVLMIIIGYVSHRCAVARKEKEEAEALAAEEDDEDKKQN